MASALRRKLLLWTAAVLAAVVVFQLATLPPLPRALTPAASPDLVRRTVAGAYHVHSTMSDGGGDAATIASAAKRAGLRFVILTDHGDATRPPPPPRYIDGVLCLDGVEISTAGGHYVALGLPATPYPLGGDAAGVVEDVRRFGGFGIVAHPDSPKRQLAWSEWDSTVVFDGIEWLNVDSAWRRVSRARLARAFADYWVRPAAALTSLLSRPEGALDAWEAHTVQRPVVALAAQDAHGGIGRTDEDGQRSAIGGIPSYEATFRAFAIRVILEAPWSGDARPDGEALLRAIRGGHVYTVIDGIATPAFVDFRARGNRGEAGMGDVLGSGPATLSLTGLPDGAEVAFVRSGAELLGAREATAGRQTGPGAFELVLPAAAGAWHAEARLVPAPGSPPVPWLVTNPIYFLEPPVPGPEQPQEAGSPLPPGVRWHPESDPASQTSVSSEGGTARLTYRLAPGERRSQFVALAVDLQPTGGVERVTFSGRSSRTVRLSVQLRVPDRGGIRWGRSVFLGPSGRWIAIPVGSLRPLDRQSESLGDAARATTLLFVIDLTNARPGQEGEFEISDVRFWR